MVGGEKLVGGEQMARGVVVDPRIERCRRTICSSATETGGAGKTEPTRTSVPPIRISGQAIANADGWPESSTTTSNPARPVTSAATASSSSGWATRPCAEFQGLVPTLVVRIDTDDFRRPSDPRMAQAVRPSIPAPIKQTRRPCKSPAASSRRGDRGGGTTCGADDLERQFVGEPYDCRAGDQETVLGKSAQQLLAVTERFMTILAEFKHFCGSPRSQNPQRPQLATIAHVTRSPALSSWPARS